MNASTFSVLKLHSKEVAGFPNVINSLFVYISQFHEVYKPHRLQRPCPKFNHNITVMQKFKVEYTGRGTWREKDIFPPYVWENIYNNRTNYG